MRILWSWWICMWWCLGSVCWVFILVWCFILLMFVGVFDSWGIIWFCCWIGLVMWLLMILWMCLGCWFRVLRMRWMILMMRFCSCIWLLLWWWWICMVVGIISRMGVVMRSGSWGMMLRWGGICWGGWGIVGRRWWVCIGCWGIRWMWLRGLLKGVMSIGRLYWGVRLGCIWGIFRIILWWWCWIWVIMRSKFFCC